MEKNVENQLDRKSLKSTSAGKNSRRKESLNSIQRRKHRWLGHVLRHDGLLCKILEGRMEGKRGRGRRRQRMIEDIMENEKYEGMKKS